MIDLFVSQGEISQALFTLLCRLEHFDLSENARLDKSTLAGYLACTMKNLKDATRIDAMGKGLKGEGSEPVLSGSVFATENMLCCAGPPLPEALKLLAPLVNLEELSLRGSNLGGTITADVAVFKKLKKLDLSSMILGGKPLSMGTTDRTTEAHAP